MASNGIGLIVHPNTVVFIGGGKGSCKNKGNKWLRRIAVELLEKYEAADPKTDYRDIGLKLSKQDIVKEIVRAITSSDGYFLNVKDQKKATEAEARAKVTQEFRTVRYGQQQRLEREASSGGSPPASANEDVAITDEDVLFGRSQEAKERAQTHPGNLFITDFAVERQNTVAKGSLKRMILELISERGGRVLIKDKSGEKWRVADQPASNIDSLLGRIRKKKIKVERSEGNSDELPQPEARGPGVNGVSDEPTAIPAKKRGPGASEHSDDLPNRGSDDDDSATDMSQACSLPSSFAEEGSSIRTFSIAASKQTFSSGSSHDQEPFAEEELDESLSMTITYDDTEFSPLTFNSFDSGQSRMNEERLRGGRTLLQRHFRVPNNSALRTSCWAAANTADDHSAITAGDDMDVIELLHLMKKKPGDASLQIRCFGDLAEIACLKQISPPVLEEVVGCVKDLIGIMNYHRQQAQVQGHCCMAFGWLAFNNPRLKRLISHYGGMDSIVDAMREHEDDETTQKNGCSALYRLADNDWSNQRKIAAGSGIEVLVRAMQNNASSTDIQVFGCTALSCVATGSTANTLSVANAGSVIAVVRAMQTHAAIEKVQLCGSWALGTLSSRIKNVRDSVVAHGGIGMILNGMSLHPMSEEVQTVGSEALLDLALDQYLNDFVDARGFEIIVSAMNNFESNETLQFCGCVLVGKIAKASSEEEGEDSVTLDRAISTLLRVSRYTFADKNVNNEARKALGQLASNNSLAQKKIAREVVGAMKSAQDDIVIQANCCSTLETIAKQDSDSRKWILAAGGAELIREARRKHPEINDVAFRALASLLKGEASDQDEENSTDIDNTVAEIITILHHTKKEKEEEKALRLLTQILTSNTSIRSRFLQAEGIHALITAMDKFPANQRIQGTGCATLYMLFVWDHDECRSSFVKRGGAHVVVKAMRNWEHCESLQYYACKIILLVTAGSYSHNERFVFDAAACYAVHRAKTLFPMYPGLTRAANETLSLIT